VCVTSLGNFRCQIEKLRERKVSLLLLLLLFLSLL